MIDLYGFPSPNSIKVAIMLEACGRPYRFHFVDLTKGAHRRAPFIERNPVGKVPWIEDAEAGVNLYGSAAILMYLADESGRFLPREQTPARGRVLDIFAMVATDLSEAFNRWLAFSFVLPERDDYAIEQFHAEILQFSSVLDGALRDPEAEYLAGDFSIADVAAAPYFCGRLRDPALRDQVPNVAAWSDRLEQRHDVSAGLTALVPDAANTGRRRRSGGMRTLWQTVAANGRPICRG